MGARHGSRRPLSARPAGEGDSVVRTRHERSKDPCQLVWQVNQIRPAPSVAVLRVVFTRENLSHLPDEPAGGGSLESIRLTKESRSPATRGGRGRIANQVVRPCDIERDPNSLTATTWACPSGAMIFHSASLTVPCRTVVQNHGSTGTSPAVAIPAREISRLPAPARRVRPAATPCSVHDTSGSRHWLKYAAPSGPSGAIVDNAGN